jgi:hypothetical protein
MPGAKGGKMARHRLQFFDIREAGSIYFHAIAYGSPKFALQLSYAFDG